MRVRDKPRERQREGGRDREGERWRDTKTEIERDTERTETERSRLVGGRTAYR